jgi:hypothetical protein
MKKYILGIALVSALAVPSAASASTPFLSKDTAWNKTYSFAHGVADRMDNGDYKDVIALVNDCSRVSRSRVDCDYEINLFPWSFDDASPMRCVDTLRIRKYQSGSTRVYLPGQPDCEAV